MSDFEFLWRGPDVVLRATNERASALLETWWADGLPKDGMARVKPSLIAILKHQLKREGFTISGLFWFGTAALLWPERYDREHRNRVATGREPDGILTTADT